VSGAGAGIKMTQVLCSDLPAADECILASFKEQERKFLSGSGRFRQDFVRGTREKKAE